MAERGVDNIAGTSNKHMGARMMLKLLWLFGLVLCLSTNVSGATDKVVCYYGSWSYWRTGNGSFKPDQIDTSVCTHVIYAFVGADASTGNINILIDNFKIFNDIKLKNPKLKTLVAVGGWGEGSSKYSTIASNAALRANFIQSAFNVVVQNNFDGFDLDWEYPARRGGVPADKENFATLIKEMKEVFEQNGLLLTAAVSATPSSVDISYDVPSLSKYLDFINVMAYDLHGAWDGVLGHNAPLYASAVDTTSSAQELNVKTMVEGWISRGADPQKLVLGLAAYGRSFTLSNTANVVVGAACTGAGNAGPHTQEAGILAYYEIVLLQLEGGWTVAWDDVQEVPYMHKGNQWITYDDSQSVALKTHLAQAYNLGGVMIWSIEIEDFNGLSGVKYPLLEAVRGVLNPSNSTTAGLTSAVTKSVTNSNSTTVTSPTTNSTTSSRPASVTSSATKSTATSTKSSITSCQAIGVTRDSGDCSVYYVCVKSGTQIVSYTKKCPSGLYYDYSCSCCNYKSAVTDCS